MISKSTFDEEMGICQKQYAKNKGCAWGKCCDCGVLPMLVKLYTGKLLEDKKEIESLKRKTNEKMCAIHSWFH